MSDFRSRGGQVTAKRNRTLALKRYYADPVICANCGGAIQVPDRVRPGQVRAYWKFCSRSCSATYTNKQRSKTGGPCVWCGGNRKHGKRFCSWKCHREYESAQRVAKIRESGVVPGSTETTRRRNAKKFFASEGRMKCFVCGLVEWRGKPITLILDHINGDSTDQRLENLRLICPNCDSQTSTWMGRNRGKGRKERRRLAAK